MAIDSQRETIEGICYAVLESALRNRVDCFHAIASGLDYGQFYLAGKGRVVYDLAFVHSHLCLLGKQASENFAD